MIHRGKAMYHFGLRMGKRWFPKGYALVFHYRMYAKYFLSGSLAAAIDLISLFVLTEFLRVHYLISVALAFVVAFFVSFTMQKFWTFRDGSREGMHSQAVMYLVVALINLGLNTLLVYFFVEIVALRFFGFKDIVAWIYLLAQAFASIILALESFFISKYVIFKNGRYNKLVE